MPRQIPQIVQRRRDIRAVGLRIRRRQLFADFQGAFVGVGGLVVGVLHLIQCPQIVQRPCLFAIVFGERQSFFIERLGFEKLILFV